jgi:hypothetical protein
MRHETGGARRPRAVLLLLIGLLFWAVSANIALLLLDPLEAATDGATAEKERTVSGLYKSSPSTLADGERDVLRLTAGGLLRCSVEGGSGSTVDTELPTAAALANNTATPTAPAVGAFLMAHDGSTWDFAPNGAGTAAAALRATLASDDPAVTALQVLDDWDETDRAKVNLISGQAGITGGAGAVGASTPRVTLASDDPGVASLAAIDDWDESDRAKVNLIASQAGITGGAGAVAANTPRATLASDDPAVVALQVIDDWDESDRAKTNPIVGQAGVAGGSGAVSATTQRVVLATDVGLPAGTSNIGDVDVASVPVVGTQANAWSAASTGAGGTSTAVDCQYAAHVTVFGNTSGASTITIQFSQDNTNFYDSETTIAANGNFGKSVTAGARYVRLKSSADVTATATIAAKD